MGEPIISFSQVEKSFGDNVIYTGVDLQVFKGETLTVIGGSGVGKSVLLKLLIGLLRPDAGQIHAFGNSVLDMNRKELQALRRRIGMLFQGAALFDSLSVEENICYPLVEHGWNDRTKMTRRVEEVLEMVGMPGIQALKPPELSGGMKKRVGLARAIAIEPDVILYDEPTTGLDPINVRRINGLILRLQEQLKVTSIVVTHDMDSCFTVTDRVAFLNNREIAWVGSREEAKVAKMPALAKFVQGGKGVLDDDEMARKEGVL
jgi:phospholipid/cholesterol/gamma-HCH transport system ATP-binding protein